LPGLATLGARFSIHMAGDGAGQPFDGSPQPTPLVDLLLTVKDPTSGKSAPGVGVNRVRLNVDASVIQYSTDFPMGGAAVELKDINSNEVIEDPIFDLDGGFQGLDYRFETSSFGNMLVGKDAAGNTTNRNQNLRSPWNFDGNDGGFTAGLGATTDFSAVTVKPYNWGEDYNFNNIEDGVCGGDATIRCFKIGLGSPVPSDPRCAHLGGFAGNRACNSVEDSRGENTGAFDDFNNNWSTKGGCGYQTRATSTCTSITTRGCFTDADCLGSCLNTQNPVVSTYRACANNGQCGTTWQCQDTAQG
jgi:hypothetical protein